MRAKKRNAPAGAATPARARNEDFEVNHSDFNSNTDGRKTPQIFALLHTGAENGTTLRELVAATGLNERVVARLAYLCYICIYIFFKSQALVI